MLFVLEIFGWIVMMIIALLLLMAAGGVVLYILGYVFSFIWVMLDPLFDRLKRNRRVNDKEMDQPKEYYEDYSIFR